MVETSATGRTFPGWEDVAEDIIPDADETYDLGSDTKKWYYLYAVIAILTSITLGGIYLGATSEGYFLINASTQINGSLIVNENITAVNITASGYYFGNGSQLTDISYTETDPYWLANYSEFLTHITWSEATNGTLAELSTVLGFSYYNSTDFDIADYYLESNPFGFYNSTNPQTELDPYWTGNQSSYFNTTDILGFNYYNSSDFDIADYSTTATILGWNYYNSTDFSISDYYSSSDIDGFSYWNDTYATFNKTYADTLYATWANVVNGTMLSQATYNTNYSTLMLQSTWNTNYTSNNAAWLNTTNMTYDAKVSFPGWDSNLAWINATNIFTANQNLTAVNVSAIDCIIFDSGGKICSGV